MSATPTDENFEGPQFLKTHGDLFSKHFSTELDEQAAVLKAHLLIEGVIRDFCYKSVRNPDHLRGLRLTFQQIVGLARSFMPMNSGTEHFWGMVNQLNKLRNLMAHELEPDQTKSDKCRDALITASGRSSLNGSLAYLCGVMHALIYVSLEIQARELLSEDERERLTGPLR
ncbi:hypothetical protein [Pseudomonas sp. W15Feb9B]|jgi:hypothetical protein|uniref:hypothetical protein n=1 Tax=Pseudomonas sp. W15Feb9B TaxID=550743 RepID=UPI0005975A7E|nr:hypothetical protein [Pseudomonas sp. W15Feb9B]KIK82981.1 hypothetical protein OC71_25440 [Pseudomonas sp. W15Feb9B]